MNYFFNCFLHVFKNSFFLSLALCKSGDLAIDGKKMDVRSIQVLVNAIRRKTCMITSLSLTSSDIQEEEAVALLNVIPLITTSLNLAYNRIGPIGVSRLFSSLPKSSLCILDLTDNSIGAVGATAIAEAFRTNTIKLTDLIIPCNNIGSTGAKAIGNALCESMHILQHLSLYNNNILDDGACAFRNARIKSLNMSTNGITARGAEHLAENLYIESLSLHYNRIGHAGANAFANSKNHVLIQIDIWGNALVPSDWKRVHDRILENRIEMLIPAWVEYTLARAQSLPFQPEVSANITCMAFFGEKHRREWETEEGRRKGMNRLFPIAESALFRRLC